VCGQVRATEADSQDRFAPSLKLDQRRVVYAGRIGADVLYSNNAALPRDAVLACGGFDVRFGPGSIFPTAEDNDLGFRLLEAGYRIVYVPEVVVYHRAWRTRADYIPLLWNYGRGQGAFYAKHASVRDGYMLRRFARQAVRHAVRGKRQTRRDLRQACGEAAYVIGLLFGAAQWIVAR
jgi:GT2 family glycosyltransferase